MDRRLVQLTQETVKRRVVGNGTKPERAAPVGVGNGDGSQGLDCKPPGLGLGDFRARTWCLGRAGR